MYQKTDHGYTLMETNNQLLTPQPSFVSHIQSSDDLSTPLANIMYHPRLQRHTVMLLSIQNRNSFCPLYINCFFLIANKYRSYSKESILLLDFLFKNLLWNCYCLRMFTNIFMSFHSFKVLTNPKMPSCHQQHIQRYIFFQQRHALFSETK